MRGPGRSFIIGMLLVGLLGAPACGPSAWERGFSGSGAVAPARAKNAPVTLREVEWDRLQKTLAELMAERVASDVDPEEWPREQKESAKARLLRCLRVSQDPASIEVLGRTDFRTTAPIRPDDGELEALARKVGATMVVWSSTYLGQTDEWRQEPVTEYRTTTVWTSRGGKKRPYASTYTETSTYWIPVVVRADEHAWVAYFLRDLDAIAADPIPPR